MATDYFSRAELYAAFCKASAPAFDNHGKATFIVDYVKVLETIPAADVREVVTCGECKYADSFSPTCTEATFPLKCLSIRYGGVYPNWFCEHGERAQKTNCGADMREES